MPVRIYALAKELKLDSKQLVEICAKAGVSGKGSALASLTDDEAVKVKGYLSGGAARTAPTAVPRERPARHHDDALTRTLTRAAWCGVKTTSHRQAWVARCLS